jgi:RNA polymerase sigma-70 factor, ECF subfamily
MTPVANAVALELPDCERGEEFLPLSSDEALLLDYVENGNRDSFEQLVRRFEREIFNYLRRYLGDEHLAEDAFQGTFLLIHRKCRQFEAGRKLRPWLYRIATNQANDLLRRNRRHKSVSLETTVWERGDGENGPSLLDVLAGQCQQPSEALESAEERQRIASAIERLPDWLKQPILLVVYQRLKYREAAAAIGIPLGTFKSRLSEAVRRLTASMQCGSVARRSA